LDEAMRPIARAGYDQKGAPARVQARQAQTLRLFRLLRLLGPPQSSKPQRLLAATGPKPTLATDSVLGARHQLPDYFSTKGRLNRSHLLCPLFCGHWIGTGSIGGARPHDGAKNAKKTASVAGPGPNGLLNHLS
jgi:hypothetical protein